MPELSDKRSQPMIKRARFFPVAIWVLTLFSASSFAQTPERLQSNPIPQSQGQPQNPPPGAVSVDTAANEIALLRKSLQNLTARLREISEKISAPDSKQGDTTDNKQNRIALDLDVLSRAEQRAESLRKQLLDWIEKDTSLRSRQVQIEEDMRPENIDRSMSLVGSTRTLEIRDARRRVLENERKGLESLLAQTGQNRLRLEDDVRQADGMVSRLRQRLLPLIEKEIDKINPN
jgi:hypothetical protein